MKAIVSKNQSTGSVIVSWDFSHGKDKSILLVGKQENGRVDIVNAFQGAEAEELYEKLVTRKDNS